MRAAQATRLLREVPHRAAGLVCYELAGWWQEFGVRAGITARPRDFTVDQGAGSGAWRELLEAFHPPFRGVVAGRQIHGTAVARHRDAPRGLAVRGDLDGYVTGRPGVLLAVTVADCVPVYLVHPATGAVGLLHAGWRGVAGGILERGLDLMCDAAEITPRDVVIHCGISICGDCYEVGPEVWGAVVGGQARKRRHLDLRGALVDRARALGVKRLTRSPWCAAHDGDRFFSHRASEGAPARMAAYIGRPAA